MPYTNGDGAYHDRRRCRRLHRTGNRIQRVSDTDGMEACPVCVTDDGLLTVDEVADELDIDVDGGDDDGRDVRVDVNTNVCGAELSSGGNCTREVDNGGRCWQHSD